MKSPTAVNLTGVNPHRPESWLRRFLPLPLLLLSLLAGTNAFGAVIFQNAITDTNPSAVNPYTNGQTFDAGITVGGLARAAALSASSAANRFSASNFATGGIDLTKYFSFTLTPNAGNTINFDTLTGNWQHSGTGPVSFSLRSSVDNFGGDIGTGSLLTTNTAQTAFSFNLGATAFDNITSAITFRIYGYGASSTGGTFSINDFAFNGTVSAIGGGTTPNYFGTTGQGVNGSSTLFDTTTLDFNTKNDGTGTAKAFDPSQVAIFGGASGVVTVSTVTANAGLQFVVNGYSLTGGQLTLATVPTIEVTTSGDTATIATKLSGTLGLTKTGAGTLVLASTTSDFAGPVSISGGILSISSDANLGNVGNGIVLNSTTLQATDNVPLAATRTFNGGGTLDVAPTKTLTFNGTVGATTPGALTLSNNGTVVFANATTNAATGLTFTGAGTVSVTGAALSLPGNIVTTNPTGTATISGTGINLGTTSRTVTVADGVGTTDLLISAPVSSTSVARLQKRGAGTLELTGDNSNLYGIQLGAQAASPADGGRILVNNKNALGAAGNTVQLNYGTLEASTDLTGANAIVSGSTASGGQLSIGGRTTGLPTFAGSNMEFTGGLGFFKSTGTSGELRFNVNNVTTISGTGIATSGTGTATGISIGGNGTLVLAGNNAAIADPIATLGTLTVQAGSATALGTGALNVTAGTLLDLRSNLGTSSLAGGGTVTNGLASSAATLTVGKVDTTTYASDSTFSGVIQNGAGTVSLVKAGGGTLTLTGANTFSGTVSITGGILSASVIADSGVAQPLGTGLSDVDISGGGTLKYSGQENATFSRGVNVSSGVGTIRNDGEGYLTLTGTLNHSGTTLKLSAPVMVVDGPITGTGPGSDLLIENAALVQINNPANSYEGSTILRHSGQVWVNGDYFGAVPASPTPGNLVIDGDDSNLVAKASFAINSNRGIAIGPSSGSGSGTLTVESGQTLTYGGIIADNGSGSGIFVKFGPGTLSTSGANTYSGGTTVYAGTFLANNTLGSATGSGPVSVLVGAKLGGSGNIAGAVTVNGTLEPGTPGAPSLLTLGALTLSATSTLNIEINSTVRGSGYSALDVNGNVQVGGVLSLSGSYVFTLGTNQVFFLVNNTGSGTTTGTFLPGSYPAGYDVVYGADFGTGNLSGGNDIALAEVPEPTTVAVALGLLGLVGWRERRRLRWPIISNAWAS